MVLDSDKRNFLKGSAAVAMLLSIPSFAVSKNFFTDIDTVVGDLVIVFEDGEKIIVKPNPNESRRKFVGIDRKKAKQQQFSFYIIATENKVLENENQGAIYYKRYVKPTSGFFDDNMVHFANNVHQVVKRIEIDAFNQFHKNTANIFDLENFLHFDMLLNGLTKPTYVHQQIKDYLVIDNKTYQKYHKYIFSQRVKISDPDETYSYEPTKTSIEGITQLRQELMLIGAFLDDKVCFYDLNIKY